MLCSLSTCIPAGILDWGESNDLDDSYICRSFPLLRNQLLREREAVTSIDAG
jgi:hypothetical protein